MTDLHLTTLKLAACYRSAKDLETNSSFETLHKTYQDQIEHTLSVIDKKIAFIVPRIRVRRGLINGLGSVVKAITGNLDYDDAVRFENEISNLRSKLTNINNSQKQSIVLAENTIQEFSNQLKKVDDNEIKLSTALRNFTDRSNVVISQLHFFNTYVQIDFSLQIILDKLMILEDAMTFAQLEVMHPSIISSKNLILEMLNMKNIAGFRPVVEISIDNIHEIERSINVKAYSTQHSLTFILEIPSIGPDIYDLIHLYSIPDQNHLSIIPASKYLALGSEEYAYIQEDCREISDQLKLCKLFDTQAIETSEDCIVSMIRHRKPNCTQAKMTFKRGKIQKIQDNSWLVITNQRELMKTKCEMKTDYKTIIGTAIINLTANCQAQIMNTILESNNKYRLSIEEIIPLPKLQDLSLGIVKYELQLEDYSLDSIHELMNRAEEIRNEPDELNWPVIMATPSWTTLMLCTIGIVFVIRKIHRGRTQKGEVTQEREDASRSTKMCFFLKGGNVT